ncbi:phosphatase PAP2 family protein [Amycolatopsis umgeniensis]|uniref:Membrane-associated phospholipid phosphatase n=1 Tax=Amycolatopsis umgeniensis TaxID=336628 RepID=A0A841BDF3_9PSEU|nr:phosphatase PAP2 family protein [Amycolatopsis umgeniensis]MBB5856990.1 membrane-associated phospholipid phosphatase [Amycolatopsis umgeniensis]
MSGRAPYGLIAVTCAVIMVVLGVLVSGEGLAGPDEIAVKWVERAFGPDTDLLRLLVLPTEAYVLIPVAAIAVALCLSGRRRLEAVLIVVGPLIAILANTWVLKPLFDRWKNTYLAYPSGHTVALVAVLTVLVLLARPGVATAVIAVVGAVVLGSVTIGMIGLGYHYLTDVVGGTLFAVAVVCATWALLTWAARRRAPAPSDG